MSSNGPAAPAERTQHIVNYFRDNELVLLEADKDEVFPSGAFGDKALQAVTKNFSSRKVVAPR